MTLEIDDIKKYLIKVGYKIEYPILVKAFKQQLCHEDPKIQSLIRTKFKDYVNELATVILENNMKFIVLRPQFCLPQKSSQRQNWHVEACTCNYNAMMKMLRKDPKLASQKDLSNGYTALHWAAKFGNLDVIKLIAGTYKVPVNNKSNAGYTPLHMACMFDKFEAQALLVKGYQADPRIRDNSGKLPEDYMKNFS